MEITQICSRGYLFSFPELGVTNVYVIITPHNIIVNDTFLGPQPMEQIMNYLHSFRSSRKILVFNSHGDWDHIWGNIYFKDSLILAHEESKNYIQKHGVRELKENALYQKGKVEITLPTLTFQERCDFPQDQVTFFHSPGHTDDSSSCYDHKDHILFVGDNLEYPVPVLQSRNLHQYIHTLELYQNMPFRYVICGHSELSTGEILRDNTAYIQALLNQNHDKLEKYEQYEQHQKNVVFLK